MNHVSPSQVKFLIVDDLAENLVALEALLRQPSLTVLKARSGREALELLLEHDIALALLDVAMPSMDGFELAELMRGMERTRRVPIIFLTAGSTDQQRRFRGYDAGAVDFITKPIEPSVLRSKADIFYELWLEKNQVAKQRDELKIATAENARLLEETRHAAEALREVDRRKDEFIAMLSHELRNPLAPMGNALQVMKVSTDPVVLADSRNLIERQLVHMVRLIDDLLDISRVTSGKVNLRTENITIRTVVESAIESTKPTIEAGQHNFTVTIPNEDIWLDADPVRLSQIFVNLLTNAAKYTPRGGSITLHVLREEDSAVIRVTDSGIGIPAEMLPKVFELFTQVGTSLERSQGGLGIGLALVKKLVELHKGTVSAESKGAGYGSVFTVSIPAKTNPQTSAAQKREDSTGSEKRTYRILIVDDNTDGAESLALLLGLDGHETKVAHNGFDGIDTAFIFAPEIIFLDIGLPGMTGYEVARKLRADERTRQVVLVAVTGWGSDNDRQQSKDAGFEFHLTKPVMIDQIEAIFVGVANRN